MPGGSLRAVLFERGAQSSWGMEMGEKAATKTTPAFEEPLGEKPTGATASETKLFPHQFSEGAAVSKTRATW